MACPAEPILSIQHLHDSFNKVQQHLQGVKSRYDAVDLNEDAAIGKKSILRDLLHRIHSVCAATP